MFPQCDLGSAHTISGLSPLVCVSGIAMQRWYCCEEWLTQVAFPQITAAHSTFSKAWISCLLMTDIFQEEILAGRISFIKWMCWSCLFLFSLVSSPLSPRRLWYLEDGSHDRLKYLPNGLVCDKCSISSVQLLSCVWLFAILWTAAHQAPLSITNSQSLLKFIFMKSVMLNIGY